MSNEGKVSMEYTSGRRRITLDPLQEIVLPSTWREVESTIPCGMRFEWVSGEDDEQNEFSLSVGAGVGSPWMTFNYKGRGFCINAQDIATALINFVNEE